MNTLTNTMTTELISIGNSKGIRLNKKLLEQIGFVATATLEVIGGKLIITPIKKKPREGWAENIRKIKQQSTKPDVVNDIVNIDNEFDKTWEW